MEIPLGQHSYESLLARAKNTDGNIMNEAKGDSELGSRKILG